MLTSAKPPSRVLLRLPTTPCPARTIEQAASLLAHQAALGNPPVARSLVERDFVASAESGLRRVRQNAGLIARSAGAPAVLVQAHQVLLDLPRLPEHTSRTLLRDLGLGEGRAGRRLVDALTRLYALKPVPCSLTEEAAVVALVASLQRLGVLCDDAAWSRRQRQLLAARGICQHGRWWVRDDDRTSVLSHGVRRCLTVCGEASLGTLAQAARRGAAGLPERHLMPDPTGLTAWVMRQPWLALEPTGLVRPAEPLRLDPVDHVIGPAVRYAKQVSRATLIDLLEQHGYAHGTAKTAVTHASYLARVSRGQYRAVSASTDRGVSVTTGTDGTF